MEKCAKRLVSLFRNVKTLPRHRGVKQKTYKKIICIKSRYTTNRHMQQRYRQIFRRNIKHSKKFSVNIKRGTNANACRVGMIMMDLQGGARECFQTFYVLNFAQACLFLARVLKTNVNSIL
jgi:predicted O-linked N-acetylglucosamine transferase (SPINDLY family)